MCRSTSRNTHFQWICDHFWSDKTIQILAYSSGFLFNGNSKHFVTSGFHLLEFCAKFATHMLFWTLGYHAYVAQHKQYCLLVMITSDRITVVRCRWMGHVGTSPATLPLQYDMRYQRNELSPGIFNQASQDLRLRILKYDRLKKFCKCLGYGLHNQGNMVRFPEVKDWSLFQSDHNSSAAHPGSYS